MQPLVYLGARATLAYLQVLQHSSHAFVCSVPTVLAAGAAHCWAVVYALIVAVLMQIIRLTGGHGDFMNRLPAWIVFTERLSSAMMLLWCLAGAAISYIRIIQVDERAQGLPVDRRDDGLPMWLRVVYSPSIKVVLQGLHTLSGAGLFASILLMCIAMFGTGGSTTTCDICLVVTACAFAVPHVVVAARLIAVAAAGAGGAPHGGAALSMASEAAIFGPQLCVLWATADIYGKASLHQRCLYVLTTLAYGAVVGTCAAAPPRLDGDALPASLTALSVSILASACSSVTLVISFPNLRDWLFWVIVGIVALVMVALSFWDVREPFLDILEPIMPLQTCGDKRLRRSWRDRLGNVLQVLVVASSGSATWSVYSEFVAPRQPAPYHSYGADFGSDYVTAHAGHHEHEQPPRFAHIDMPNGDHAFDEYPASDSDAHDDMEPHDQSPLLHPMHGSGSTDAGHHAWLVLRWRQDAHSAGGDVEALMALVARSMGVQQSELAREGFLYQQRLLLFSPHDPEAMMHAHIAGPAHMLWKRALHEAAEAAPGSNGLADIADLTFPSQLDGTLCRQAARGGTVDEEGVTLQNQDAREAYTAACHAWFAEIGHHHHDDDDHHDYAHHDE